jgi:Zn-dependent membrane protease YugP
MIDYILYPLFILSLAFAVYAQIKVNNTFKKYSKVSTYGRTAGDLARYILDKNGLYEVKIERVKGHLTDHFDPQSNVLRLSDSVYNSTSCAAIGVAAHEVGHAIQHSEGYMPTVIRQKIVPVTNFASRLIFPVIIAGILLMSISPFGIGYYVMIIGIALIR